jgi:predicted membrane metal-binding protein
VFVDPGLHLSFLATLFIITILPILKNKLAGDIGTKPKWKTNLLETVILAVGLPIFMLPYMMYFSGLFPLVSPIANIVLVPIIPILMLGGLTTLVLSFVPFLASIFGAVTSFVGIVAIKIVSFYIVLFTIIFRKNIKLYFEHLRNIFQPLTN